MSDSYRERCEKRPLYSAIQKYGKENFIIELVEETSNENSSKREIFWINYYETFKSGYNATVGGEGAQFIDYDLVVKIYRETQNQNDTAKILDISISSVCEILKIKKEDKISRSQVVANKLSKAISAYDLQGNFIKNFTGMDAARWLQENNIASKNTPLKFISGRVHQVANGQRLTAHGFKWKFIEA